MDCNAAWRSVDKAAEVNADPQKVDYSDQHFLLQKSSLVSPAILPIIAMYCKVSVDNPPQFKKVFREVGKVVLYVQPTSSVAYEKSIPTISIP